MSITSNELSPEYIVSLWTPTTSISPSFLHPTRPVIAWAASNIFFSFNFGLYRWEQCRVSYHENTIRSIDYNLVKGLWMTASEDRKVYLIEDETYKKLYQCTIEAKITSACFVNNEDVAVSDKFGRVIVLKFRDFVPITSNDTRFEPQDVPSHSLESFDVEMNQPSIDVNKKEEHILINDSLESKNPVFGHMAVITSMKSSHDKKWLVTVDRDSKIRLCSTSTLFLADRFFFGHKEFISGALIVYFKGHNILISGSGDGKIIMFDLFSGLRLDTIELKKDFFESFESKPSHSHSKETDDTSNTIRYFPSQLYWEEESQTLVALVEGFQGFLEIFLTIYNPNNDDSTRPKFEKATVHNLISQPQALIPLPQCHKEQFYEGMAPNSRILFWINSEGKLMTPYDMEAKMDILKDIFALGQNIGEPVTSSKAYYWKTIRGHKGEIYAAKRALRKRKES